MATTHGLAWTSWTAALLMVAWDALTQRFSARHVPRPLPLPPLSHLTIIVTGATSGIGLHTAKALANAGAHLVFAVRNTNDAHKLISKWQSELPDDKSPLHCEVMWLDCLSFDSVRDFAKSWEAQKRPLNVLINNAGIYAMTENQKFSKDDCEHHMQVNHLAPALLTVLLLPSLARGAPSRVIMLNSFMHHLGYVDPKDLNMKGDRRKYWSTTAYSSSKLAQVMFSNFLQRRIPKEAGVYIICVHPGEVITKVVRNLPRWIQIAQDWLGPPFLFLPEEGARAALFCATDTQVQNHARHLRDLDYPVVPYIGPDLKIWSVAKQAFDLEKANLVWEETLKLVGLLALKDAVEHTNMVDLVLNGS